MSNILSQTPIEKLEELERREENKRRAQKEVNEALAQGRTPHPFTVIMARTGQTTIQTARTKRPRDDEEKEDKKKIRKIEVVLVENGKDVPKWIGEEGEDFFRLTHLGRLERSKERLGTSVDIDFPRKVSIREAPGNTRILKQLQEYVSEGRSCNVFEETVSKGRKNIRFEFAPKQEEKKEMEVEPPSPPSPPYSLTSPSHSSPLPSPSPSPPLASSPSLHDLRMQAKKKYFGLCSSGDLSWDEYYVLRLNADEMELEVAPLLSETERAYIERRLELALFNEYNHIVSQWK
jgi:hypothetical protein